MRVIAGTARRKQIKAPRGDKVRPTSDRVREAMFNILGPLVENSEILDLFAGSGALGIEALSRGGKSCVFVEKDNKVLRILKENLKNTGFEDKGKVYQGDVEKILQILARKEESFYIIFMDPPYGQELELRALKNIINMEVLKPGGVVVVETHKKQEMPENISILNNIKSRNYGDTKLTFYKKSNYGVEEEIACE